MRTEVWVYSIGIIDYWFGWHTEAEWLALLQQPTQDWFGEGHVADYFRFKEEALAAARRIGWEGDFRGGPFVAPLPLANEPGVVNELFMIGWKQDNNGSTFIASPVQLPHLGGDRIVRQLVG